jgi:cobalt-zinc-cadmium efflux system outer membrane protein
MSRSGRSSIMTMPVRFFDGRHACSCRVIIALFLLTVTVRASIAQGVGTTPAVLTLRALLDSVQTHPTSLAAESRVRAARGSRVTAGAFGNPMLSYQVDQTPFPGGHPLIGMEREAMTTATLPLEFLYQRGPRVSRANADLRAAQSEALLAKRRLALDAAAAYYRVAIAQVQVATSRDLLGWLDTLVTYNRSRVHEGVAAEADLIRSELERDRVAAETAMQEAERAQARSSLAGFISASPGTGANLTVAVDDAPFALPGFVGSIDARPDVQAARERVTASNAAVASERTMLVRQLGATIGTMQTGHMTSMIAGVSLPVPVFDQNRGEIQRTAAEHDAASYELASQQRAANAELQGALDAARILTERASVLVRRDSSGFLARADESRRIALGAYREGAVPLFQVIDAARAWVDARMTYYRTIAAQHQSVLSLLVAQGLDLSSALPDVTSRGASIR